MKNKIGYLGLLGIPLAVLGIAGSVAFAQGQTVPSVEPSEHQVAITGDALTRASQVALAHTGAGRVTETEVNDEESYYEVEVTLDNGNQVDVQLDESFKVVGQKVEGPDNDNETGN